VATRNMMRGGMVSHQNEVKKEMDENNEPNEVIEFCLKHDLIKKTDQGYIIKKEFFDILDYYNMEG
jgi:hypothetical protein